MFDRTQGNRPDTTEPQRGGTTIRMADYQTRAGSSTSWAEVQIRREEIRLPQDREAGKGRPAPPRSL